MPVTTNITLPANVRIGGSLSIDGTKPSYLRSELTQEQAAVYPIRPTDLRVWDNMALLLPATPSADDLGLVTGTLGTAFPTPQTEDLKTLGATNKRAAFIYPLPPEYDGAADVVIRANAGMLTNPADVTATIDFEAYLSDRAGLVGADLVSTAAQSINSVTLTDKLFIVTATSLSPGDLLQIRMTLAINDAASAGVVKGIVAALEMLLDIRG